MISSTQESTLCRKYGLIPAKTPTGSYLIWQGWVYSKTFNVGTSSGETGESSSGRTTLFMMYNLSPRKHYSSIKQGIGFMCSIKKMFCKLHSFPMHVDSPINLDALQLAWLKLKKHKGIIITF